jgi:ribosomal protein S18 acetylase RimI-like enzyme
MSTSITRYAAAHFHGVDALWREVFPDDPPWNRAEFAIPAKLAVQPELFLVALDGECVVGSVMGGYDGHRGWVYLLGVPPEEQGNGIGRRLMDEMETLLKARGCVKVNVQVRTSNEKVIAFYERLGYTRDACVGLGKRFDGKERGEW